MDIHKNMSTNISNDIIIKNRNNLLRFMKDTKITTTSEVSGKLNLSWNTAEKRLLELAIENKVHKIKKAGVNLWVLKE